MKPDLPTLSSRQDCVVLHSGGADSTICLWWATQHFERVHPVAFDYQQKHRAELECAQEIWQALGLSGRVIPVSSLDDLGGHSLHRQSAPTAQSAHDLPHTFVPGRNVIFLSLAAAWAWQKNCRVLVSGVCQTDYSGYPDCRQDTISALEKTLRLGMDCAYELVTPLMNLSKAQSVLWMEAMGGLELLAKTLTCYEGQRPGCGQCAACQLRARGFAEAGRADPLRAVP